MRDALERALVAAALAGLFFGTLDGVLALRELGPRLSGGVAARLGCTAAAVLVYGLVFFAFAFVLAATLRARGSLLAATLGLGVFVEAYWRSRPWIFPGRPALSPERLASAGAIALVALGITWLAARLLRSIPERALVRGARAAGIVGALGALYLVVDAQRSDTTGALHDGNRDMPNVVLIVADALRADVLEPYGNELVATPNLTRLARRGVTFESAFVQAPVTWTSFGSLLTGKYPLRHGLISMKPGVRMRESLTIPALLKNALGADGVATAVFMTGTLSHGTGLLHGFDAYSEMLDGHELVDRTSPWSLTRSELTAFRIWSKLRQRVDSHFVVSNAVRWLRRHADRRFAIMVHLYSTHTPYDPPAAFRDPYADPAYDGPFRAFYAQHRIAVESGRIALRPEDREQIRRLYYGGTSQMDADVDVLLGELERLALLDDTLVVFTADHGEELGEHGVWEHNWMYDTNLHVPLILAWPRRLPQGARVSGLVELVDVLPTVCALLGLELPFAKDEYELVDGHDLVPLIEGEVGAVREVSFSMNTRFLSARDEDWKLIVPSRLVEAGPELDTTTPTGTRLFHLAEDPGEKENLLPTDDEAVRREARRLHTAVREWHDRMPIPHHEVRSTSRDHENVRILRELGYVEGLDEDG